MKHAYAILSITILGFLALTSCSIDDEGANINDNAALGIVFNASPDSENLFFFANTNRINRQTIDFNEGEGYSRFFKGNRDISVVNEAGNELASTELQMNPRKFYSIFATDSLSNIALLTVEDSLVRPANEQFNLRFIHLSPNAPQVNFFVGDTNLGEFNFKEYSQFRGLQNGTYDLKITDNAGNEILVEENVNLQSGHIYTYLAVGFLGANNANRALQIRRITNF